MNIHEIKGEIEEKYARYTARKFSVIFILLASLIALAILVTPLGTASLSVGDVFNSIFSRGSGHADMIIWGLRLPRILMAIICGMGLALSGAVVQGVLHNPLASPFTLGVSSAAFFGGMIATAFGVGMGLNVGFAFLFGMLALFLIYRISKQRGMTSETMILCGICLMYLFLVMASLISGFGAMGGIPLLTGNLVSSSWDSVSITSIFLAVTFPLLMKYAWDLNAMVLGDDTATSAGVNVNRTRLIVLALAILIVSAIVCFTGVIGFVCLISPFIARSVMGNDHRFIFPCSALIGALLLLGTDTLARTAIQPIEIPVGMIMTIIGIPFILYLAVKRSGFY
ncbi:MAG: iron ABC transporter permease [Candidatus Methanoliparum thermophilum]|uniref:Iron ABC transporter permease n=1 Tax=Methanoliparum thermophilum TaxID=2491083 RepID=A0A520KQX6_METT2|nr:iron ABC transporter permease [Candidatus Methanoliparum sp. LAM-1]RZN63975.1 MAG: iron ABC transporter permease [Candidatus Methanoliparum thermophilum]BDC36550.1 iron ABC transporter permease [Candidatus Methanoliparum sp. LAM-1]